MLHLALGVIYLRIPVVEFGRTDALQSRQYAQMHWHVTYTIVEVSFVQIENSLIK